MKKIILLLAICLFFSCKNNGQESLTDFTPFSNFNPKNDTLELSMDLNDAIRQGIILPSPLGADGSMYFTFSFKVKNPGTTPNRFFYKIFYQNESYKIPEVEKGISGTSYNTASEKNFYGSWEDPSDQFHQTQEIPADGKFHQVTDSFRIVGNPRNEKICYGAEMVNRVPSAKEVDDVVANIKRTPAWLADVVSKAKRNNITAEEQMVLDATWLINQERKKGDANNRWKRNPRTGCYSFMIVVCDGEQKKNIPYYISDIGKQDTTSNVFVNPFYFFLHTKPAGVMVQQSNQVLKTKAKLVPDHGVYVDIYESPDWNVDRSHMNQKTIGNTDELYSKAHFQQFFHSINKNYIMHNVPLVADVTGGGYTRQQYDENVKKYANSLKNQYVSITNAPGKTVGYDPSEKAVWIRNPGNTDVASAVKENTGVKTRIGFTYGKYRAKIKFPSLLNKMNVWNGVTCAFWLLYQDEGDWNKRCACEKSGYIPKYEVGKTDNRERFNNYSEIDIEIVKTSAFWPRTCYYDGEGYQFDDGRKDHNIIVACTNWDLACRDPKKFNIGAKPIEYKGQTFMAQRWDDYYKALTSKYATDADNVVGSEVYFEIEWLPEEIIWRMGKDKNNMKIIGYMNKDNTKIPDNQMIALMTQEFHDASWWPPAPWLQDNIPFPAKDITGYIYEIEVE